MLTCPSIGPSGGPAAAIPAGIFVFNLVVWVIFSAVFFKALSFPAALDIFDIFNENRVMQNK